MTVYIANVVTITHTIFHKVLLDTVSGLLIFTTHLHIAKNSQGNI